MEKLITQMRVAFATNFTYYLEAHNAHWNIIGPDFPQYHEFLNDVYSDAQTSIDTYAEKIRQLHAFAQGTYPEIIAESILTDPTEIPRDPVTIFEQLVSDAEILVAHLQDTYDEAGIQREYGIQNFLADRIDAHKQQIWMMRSILGLNP
jgi:starvation-inducible DNA-binding protein